MPSPSSNPRSSSFDPTLSKTLHSHSHLLVPSNQSKVGRLMRRKSQSSKHSDLTEENVEAHNRRNDNNSNSTSSYKYKGIAASGHGSSPERKSHAPSVATFMGKMRGLGSCFKRDNSEPATYTMVKAGRSPLKLKEMTEKRKEKPLRERVPAAPALAPAPAPAPPPTEQVMNEKDSNEKEFIWANKYQPKALEDFICNRDKAIELRALIREGGCGHIIFEGPPGVGKRTMIWAMLREAFGK